MPTRHPMWRFHVAQSHGPCPVCAGSGRVDAKASRADAVADAETLTALANYMDLHDWRGNDGRFGSRTAYFAREARLSGESVITNLDGDYWPPQYAREAARAAFRAVPGLRGK